MNKLSLIGIAALALSAGWVAAQTAKIDPASVQTGQNAFFNAVDAAHKAGVKKFVTASSASIYGLADTFPTPEDHHPYNNRTWYGASKMMLEGLLRSYNDMYGFPYVAHRYFNVYGPRMDIHGKYTEVLIRWMERIDAGKPPLIFGDGAQTMDFVYIDDVARANVLALASDVSDEIFNVASGVETSLNTLVDLLGQVCGREPTVRREPPRHGEILRNYSLVEKAREHLGYEPAVQLEEGLRRTYEWFSSERAEALR